MDKSTVIQQSYFVFNEYIIIHAGSVFFWNTLYTTIIIKDLLILIYLPQYDLLSLQTWTKPNLLLDYEMVNNVLTFSIT
jgi:hypothetical protein